MSAPEKSSCQVSPTPALRGVLTVPGDKSITHRIALLGALANGETIAQKVLVSDDSRTVLRVLGRLGVEWTLAGDTLYILGRGPQWRAPEGDLDLGNSGTGIRLLAGLLAGQPFTSRLTGDASLSSRPMNRIRDPLTRMGVAVELEGEGGRLPAVIHGGRVSPVEYVLPVASAQVKSCVLLAGLFAEGLTTVVEKRPTRDHTERLLQAMGVPVETDGLRVTIRGSGSAGPALPARSWVVPGDFSAAAFWLTAAACLPGSDIEIRGVGLNPRRTALLGVLRRMGANIEIVPDDNASACETMGTLRVRGGALRGTRVLENEVPDMIDELPLVAMAGARAEGTTVITGAAELRVKESDRIESVATGLRAMGVEVTTQPDGMEISGSSVLRGGGRIDSHGDHRIPMAFSLLALAADGPVTFTDVGCVAKSYPHYWDDLQRLGGSVEHRSGN
jgi:3-phosphoshikimate 1-carboxyvinyltransferase